MVELFSSLSSADYFRMAEATAIMTVIIYKLYMAVAETRAREVDDFIIGWADRYVISHTLKLQG